MVGKLKASTQTPVAGESRRRTVVRRSLRRFCWGVLGGSGHALGSTVVVWLAWWVRTR
ncbi:hypothetical protein ACIQI7_08895 [Kitasatospora sp. NPDC092039]|uniref:hypothetical protein n=1 Tax=Kitasatospora sp. NPDC092039 TaxID=3364086 RepID=UPI0037F1C39A